MRYVGYILVLIHIILFLWSAGGAIEMISTDVPWTPYTNPDFPGWLLPIHWGSVWMTSTGFLYGYFSKWSKTPEFMFGAYVMLSVICIVETFGFMTSQTKFIAMVAELVTYTVIVLILFKHKYFIAYFGGESTGNQ